MLIGSFGFSTNFFIIPLSFKIATPNLLGLSTSQTPKEFSFLATISGKFNLKIVSPNIIKILSLSLIYSLVKEIA